MEARIKDFVDFSTPFTRKELRHFLGMIGFYRMFCRDFAQISAPLTDMLIEKICMVK